MAAATGATSEELTPWPGRRRWPPRARSACPGRSRRSATALKGLLLNPVTILLAIAAAIGVVAYKIFTANDNTQKWITGMDAALAKSSNYR